MAWLAYPCLLRRHAWQGSSHRNPVCWITCQVLSVQSVMLSHTSPPHIVCGWRQEREVGGFKAEAEEEFEDAEGNVYNKRTYEDLKRQGLI